MFPASLFSSNFSLELHLCHRDILTGSGHSSNILDSIYLAKIIFDFVYIFNWHTEEVPVKVFFRTWIQSRPTSCNPLNCGSGGFSILGNAQARKLEWVAISSSRGPSWPRHQIHASCIAGRFFTTEPISHTLLRTIKLIVSVLALKLDKNKFNNNHYTNYILSWYPAPSLHGKQGNNGKSERLYFGGLQNHCRWWLQPWKEKALAPWKKRYERPRQHIKKQRHDFANKGLSSQGYGFSNSHVQMWELDYKES